jgi:predicted alpha/beta-fold hydrolase
VSETIQSRHNDLHEQSTWLFGGHAQTIYPFIFLRGNKLAYERQTIATPDDDFLHIDWINRHRNGPLVVLLHGLEGNSQSHYARSMMTAVRDQGWSGCVINFRGCSGSPNRLPRAYHSGDSGELEWIFNSVAEFLRKKLFIVGYSLGGNVLLHWMGQQKYTAHEKLTGACAVSTPYDLVKTGEQLSSGIHRLYGSHFLRSLKRKAIQKIINHGLEIKIDQINHCKTLKDFDDTFTAPMHGFSDVYDYWHKASSKPFIPNIKVKTLLIQAQNDPFLPDYDPESITRKNSAIELKNNQTGGHVGFVGGHFPGNVQWIPRQVINHFKQLL